MARNIDHDRNNTRLRGIRATLENLDDCEADIQATLEIETLTPLAGLANAGTGPGDLGLAIMRAAHARADVKRSQRKRR